MAYRTKTQIIADILTATQDSGMDGIRVSTLLRKSNTTHVRLHAFLKDLVGSGLVNHIEFDGKRTFVITPKGRQYLEQYRAFSVIAESYGLEM